ncbi:helix-turn-helix transcriptional regulator [uncultured Rikenella sp.]|uniref:helix-turn-helix domain-containing protein n=1 Tax=uncultured Rikenella sp. TaxID=368003 RepID=UPI0025DA5C7B|nr:helix-turn-helix transcriptional regulator [uncultured Rikenella sp.]
MKTKNKAEEVSIPLLDSLIDENSKYYRMVECRMRLAGFIADLIKQKGWTNGEFARKMGKQPSVISKWLSGTHNFTTETLWEIEEVIGEKIIPMELPKSRQEHSVRYIRSLPESKIPLTNSFDFQRTSRNVCTNSKFNIRLS